MTFTCLQLIFRIPIFKLLRQRKIKFSVVLNLDLRTLARFFLSDVHCTTAILMENFRNHLNEFMSHIGFTLCLADPDVWMSEAHNANGLSYWEYVLLYVDDALVISDDAQHIFEEDIGKYFTTKPVSIGPPTIYLGGQLRRVTLDNGLKVWDFSLSKYVQDAAKSVEEHLARTSIKLPSKALTPIQTSYRPEIDTTVELNATELAYYQSIIGILRWMVELGRDILARRSEERRARISSR